MQGKAFGVSDTLPLSRNGSHEIQSPSPVAKRDFSETSPATLKPLQYMDVAALRIFSGAGREWRSGAGTWGYIRSFQNSPHVNFFYCLCTDLHQPPRREFFQRLKQYGARFVICNLVMVTKFINPQVCGRAYLTSFGFLEIHF